MINELTKGLYGGTLKINGVSVPVEVELIGSDNVKKVFITKVINIDKKYLNKIPSNGILEIPARVFRLPGGGWYKIKQKAFEYIDDKGNEHVATSLPQTKEESLKLKNFVKK
jgi:hypothetical protein